MNQLTVQEAKAGGVRSHSRCQLEAPDEGSQVPSIVLQRYRQPTVLTWCS